MEKAGDRREIPALRVHQWLAAWEQVQFSNGNTHKSRPEPYFYVFSLQARQLKALSGIQRRSVEGGQSRSQDLGIQRRHDERRSDEIREFIHYGYPWSELSQAKRNSGQYDDLRKPGWLPTAIVVNILKAEDRRHGKEVAATDLIRLSDDCSSLPTILLPETFCGAEWRPKELHPIEVIDGQHRLWAFEEDGVEGEYELPVVAFHGLDISWQAYLFWTINIKPKRINASLAFDLYPLLRTADWLERFEGHSIYRETRAQELTEALWAHPDSPWYDRINMLGEAGLGKAMVSQAAWIRSLMATCVKAWEGKATRVGGLFGAPVGSDKGVLPWDSAQQAAFLIVVGKEMRNAIAECDEEWAQAIRLAVRGEESSSEEDPAFFSPYALFNTDQGIRGILYVGNDLCYIRAEELELDAWVSEQTGSAADTDAVSTALSSLYGQGKTVAFIREIAARLISYDWRTSSFPGLPEEARRAKAGFRGSGGYRELRLELLRWLVRAEGDVGRAAKDVLTALGCE